MTSRTCAAACVGVYGISLCIDTAAENQHYTFLKVWAFDPYVTGRRPLGFPLLLSLQLTKLLIVKHQEL